MRTIIDSESDALLDEATKIHCICIYDIDTGESRAIINYDEMREFLETENLTLIGHNLIRFDIPLFKKILGVDFKGRKVDTLATSYYLYPLRETHNLADWGVDVGVMKPIVDDWSEQPLEVYVNRCTEDVKINFLVFNKHIHLLTVIYNGEDISRIINYLMFKFECAREQEGMRWRINLPKCIENMEILQKESAIKMAALQVVIPDVNTYRIAKRPKVFLKKDGSLSANGEKWLELMRQQGLPEYHIGDVKVITGQKPGNPGGHQQIKNWLFSLGWIPQTFKYTKPKKDKHNPDVQAKKVPQLRTPEGFMCESVELLIEKEPALENLRDFFVINHRITILKGFLENHKGGYVQAQIMGFTNTLRFIHTQVVNLPTIMKAYGQLVREVLIAPEGYILCGADMTGLENSTRDHYMYPYDPKYVEEMRVPFFDSHIDIALRAGLMTEEEGHWFKWYKAEEKDKPHLISAVSQTYLNLVQEEAKKLKARLAIIRDKSKKSNFASVYGAGAAKIALTAGISLELAALFHKTYWQRNWAIKKIANSCKIRTVDGQMWLYNPVSGFWYSLRFEKDKFSTLNQGTGVYCFDTWIKYVRQKEIKICGQFHDEIVAPLRPCNKDKLEIALREAIDQTNADLQLNVTLGISVQFGENYASIH